MNWKDWLAEFQRNLAYTFAGRVLFFGLQGSCRRGEAGPDSDLDLVTVLDRLETADLAAYRTILAKMPPNPRPCGFICGLEELRCWPRYDLFSLYYDTEPLYGSLDTLIGIPGTEDARMAIRAGASALLHEVCHRSIHSRDLSPTAWAGAVKQACFLAAARYFLRTGRYPERFAVLAEECTGAEQIITAAAAAKTAPPDCIPLLLEYCKQCLGEVSSNVV